VKIKFCLITIATLLAVMSFDAFGQSRLIVPVSNNAKTTNGRFLERARFYLDRDSRLSAIDETVISAFLREQSQNEQDASEFEEDYKRAKKLLAAGWKDYKRLDLKKAIKQLEEAKSIFRQVLPFSWETKNLLTAYLHLGIAFNAAGKTSRAEQEIKEMVILDPARKKRKLKAKYYSPEVIKLYEKIRDATIKNLDAKLVIETTPSEAEIWLDGEKLDGGLAADLPEGEHFIFAKAKGHTNLFSTKYLIPGDNAIALNLEPNKALNSSSYFSVVRSAYDIPQDVANFLDKMSIKLNADLLFFFELIEDGQDIVVTAQFYDQRSQEVSPKKSETIGTAANEIDRAAKALTDSLLTNIDNRGYVASTTQDTPPNTTLITPDTPSDALSGSNNVARNRSGTLEKPWYKKWWVYAIIGGSAAAAGAAFFLTSGSSDPSTSTLQIDNPSN
jgi:tetratricopeptide (TPR) repeat protein